MTVTQIQRPRLEREDQLRSGTRVWIPVAVLLAAAGWGSNQFTPILLVYSSRLGLSTATLEALFGAYAVGLIPGLLVAGRWSDAHGRRATGMAAAGFSLLATVSLAAGAHALPLLFIGRLLAGLGSGAAFGAGTAWLREVSLPPFGAADTGTAARRAAVAMTTGFALGPLVAGVLAQWAPDPSVVPYLPHLALIAFLLPSLRRVPETVGTEQDAGARVRLPHRTMRRFRRVVVPMAPWIFAAPAIGFALLPSIVGTAHAADGIAVTAAITSLTAVSGVLIQPIARRLGTGAQTHGVVGLIVLAGGLALAALTADLGEIWLLVPCAIVLGGAYGFCLVAGLHEVQRIAPPQRLAGLTAVFYAFTYLGFGAPYLVSLSASAASYPVLLVVIGGLALLTAAWVGWAANTEEHALNPVAD